MAAAQQSTMLGDAGFGLALGGAVADAVGSYYAVKAMQYQARMQASALHHQQQMSYIEARQAERDAQRATRAGQREGARLSLQYGQAKAATTARQAAAGIQGGVGSAAEIAASIEYAKQSDRLVIDRNAVLEANAHRTRRTNAVNSGLFAGTMAANVRRMSGAVSPELAGVSSLLGSGAGVVDAYGKWRGSR